MRRRFLLVLPAMMFVMQPAAALKPQAVIYYKLPFGGQTKKSNTPKFGLQLNSRRNTDIVRKRPLLGMELSNNSIDNIRFRNLYLLGKRHKYKRRDLSGVDTTYDLKTPSQGDFTGTAPLATRQIPAK